MLQDRQFVQPNALQVLQASRTQKSVAGVSEPDVEEEVLEPAAAVEPMAFESRPSQFHAAFAKLDHIDLKEIFSNRAAVMRSAPSFFRGALRTTMRVALTEFVKGTDEQSNVRMMRGWKLFLLFPRLLLLKPLRGGLVPKKTLEARFHLFQMVNGMSCQHPQRSQDSAKVRETATPGARRCH